uniref:C2H2-type domain-containing protein n=1 Tax=viral metagenome TaxID=1070528 RepID=A0A6H2A6K8_9ZZZZ
MESKIVSCIDCGKEYPRKELNRRFRCPDCAMRIIEENMLQLHRHEGPHYEKWRKAVQAAVGKL